MIYLVSNKSASKPDARRVINTLYNIRTWYTLKQSIVYEGQQISIYSGVLDFDIGMGFDTISISNNKKKTTKRQSMRTISIFDVT